LRPLDHYDGNLDYLFFQEDQELYEALSERAEKLIEEEKNKFLGEFANAPGVTFKELNEELTFRKNRVIKLKQLRGPEIVIENELQNISELENKLKNKEFINFSDKASLDYKKAHDALSHAFWQSKEYKTLLKEIYEYNEHAVSKIFNISSFEKNKDELEWLNS
jgi:hypothetical protein